MNVDKLTFLETLEVKSAMSSSLCESSIEKKIKAIREKYNEKRKKETLLGG